MIAVLLCAVFALSSAAPTGTDAGGHQSRDVSRRVLMGEETFETLVNTVHQLQAEVATLKDEVAKRTHTPVAFSARLSHAIASLQAKQLIYYDDVRFNVGHGYHSGTFVAPVNGTYMFVVSGCSPNAQWVVLDLMRNGVAFGQFETGDDAYNSCSTHVAVTELVAGDDVNVQHNSSLGGLLQTGQHFNAFTGVLLYENYA